MQLVTNMMLPHLPLEQPAFDEDPTPFLTAARKEHAWLAKVSEGYFVHGYEAVKDLSRMDTHMRPSFDGVVEYFGAKGTSWGNWMEKSVLALHGPDHSRIRESIASAFTPRYVNRLRPLIRERIAGLLDEWAPKAKFDFVDFASNFPISIMCGVLGSPVDDIPFIRDALETQGLVFSLDRSLLPRLLASYDKMWAYVDKLIIDREKEGPRSVETLLDTLIATKNSGKIDETELRYLLLVLFPAGYDTSRNFLTFTVYTLLQRPGLWERCAEDVDYCGKVLEEMLRHNSISTPFRTVIKEFTYGDIHFPEGTRLFLGNAVAGRDPSAFPNPDEFQPERPYTNRHVAFGRGAHMCVGQHLASAQIVEALHMITQRITKPRLIGEVKWRVFLGTRGPTTLPIEFEPAPARVRLGTTHLETVSE